ncbi:MAG TPA: hypothetical protein VGO92_15360, partial [Acidimicrobiales bacterium]|nr:hypothetical protein [Acidimicrobiales bacterium]
MGLVLMTGAQETPLQAAPTVQLPDLQPERPPYAEISGTYEPTAGLLYLDPPTLPLALRFPTVAENMGGYPVDL